MARPDAPAPPALPASKRSWRRRRAPTLCVCALVAVALAATACSDDTAASGRTTDAAVSTSDTAASGHRDIGLPPEDVGPADAATGQDAALADTGTADIGVDAGVDTGPAPPQVTRLIVMGDTGEGNAAQARIARGAQARCDRAGGCVGFVMLGDDIYDSGPSSANDTQFDTKIDQPYQVLKKGPPPPDGQPDNRPRMPIYVALGNHDLGGAGLNRSLIDYYLAYAQQHDWFYLPSAWWTKKVGNVQLIALETNSLAYLGTHYDEQGQMVQQALADTDARWSIVFGHHTYRSNGQHGNAGSYEGIPGDLTYLGGDFRKFVDEFICNKADFYLAGHDHNRQWFNSVPDIPTWPVWQTNQRPCNTWFGVSGAGSKLRTMVDRNNDLAFGQATLGFLFMEFYPNKVVVEECDPDGNTEWTRTLTGH